MIRLSSPPVGSALGVFLVAFFGLAALAAAGVGFQGAERERVVFMSALDEAGAPVTDLTASEVVIREDGVAREVLQLSRANDPMHIALVVDNSQAATPAIGDLRRALPGFVQAVHDRNQIALITIASRPTIGVDYTSAVGRLNKAIQSIFAFSDTGAYLLEALTEITRGIKTREIARPVIVALITEGVEFSNDYYETVLSALRESGAAFYAIVLPTDATAPLLADPVRNRSLVLDLGTRATGGRRQNLMASSALPGTLKQLAAELANQYRVVYARPGSLIPPTAIDVSVRRAGVTARGTPAKQRLGGAP